MHGFSGGNLLTGNTFVMTQTEEQISTAQHLPLEEGQIFSRFWFNFVFKIGNFRVSWIPRTEGPHGPVFPCGSCRE